MATTDAVRRAAEASRNKAKDAQRQAQRDKTSSDRLGRVTPNYVSRDSDELKNIIATNPYVTEADVSRNWQKLREYHHSPEYAERTSQRQQNVQKSLAKEFEAEEYERVQMDFAKLAQGTPEEVDDWRNIANTVVRLGEADGDEAKEAKNALLWQYGEQLRPHIDVIDKDWWDKNYEEFEDNRPWYAKAVDKARPVLDYLDQWGQSSMSAIAGLEAAFDTNDEVSFGEGMRHAVRQGASALDVTRAIPGWGGLSSYLDKNPDASIITLDDGTELSLDRDKSGEIGLREALGKDPDSGGRVLGAIDLIGQIALDPSTYVTLGQGSIARTGMKAAEEMAERLAREAVGEALEFAGKRVNRELVQEMNQRIMREGFKNGLDDAEQRFYRSLVQRANDEAVARGTGRATSRLGRDVVDAQMQSIAAGGQSGMRFAGRTVLPTNIGERLGRRTSTFGERAAREIPQQAEEFRPLMGEGPLDPRLKAFDDGPTSDISGALPIAPEPGRLGDVLARADDAGLPAGPVSDASRIIPQQRAAALADEGFEIRGLDDAGEVFAKGETSPVLRNVPDAMPPGEVTELAKAMSKVPEISRLGDETAAATGLREVFQTGVKRGLMGDIMEMMPERVKRIFSALSPRRKLNAVHGNDVGDEFAELLSRTRTAPEAEEAIIRLGADMNRNGLMRRSLEEFANRRQWDEYLNEALSNPQAMEEALNEGGREATRNLLQTLKEVREATQQAAIRGGANPDQLRDLDTYLPRVLSKAARENADLMEQIRNLDDPVLAKSRDKLTEGFLKKRTLAEDLDNLLETNAEAARVLENAGIASTDELFETNVVAALVARNRSAFRAQMDVELLDGITDIRGVGGIEMGFRVGPEQAGKLSPVEAAKGQIRAAGGNVADYRRVDLENGTTYMVHKDIARELEDVRRIFGDPRQITEFGRVFDKINNLWARQATVFGVNPAFHIRNMVGNVFNAFLGGTRDVSVFRRAISMQQDLHDITVHMRKTGDNFATAAQKLELDENVVEILTQARRSGVLNDGRGVDILRTSGGVDETDIAANRLNPLGDNFAGDTWGRNLGMATENNARLAVYLDQLNKGATHTQASQHVKRYLFDYGDLTRFENESLRRVSRFYTFMRKNTALQAYTLAHYPARIANAEAGVQGVVDFATGGDSPDGGMKPPPWMPGASITTLPGTGNLAAVGVDTPFASFEDTMRILTGPPRGGPADRLVGESWLRGAIGRTEALFSGFGPGVIEFFEEMESGRDSFTGRALDPKNQMRDTAWFRAASTVLPGMNRLESWGSRNKAINEALQLRTDKEGNLIGNVPWQQQLINNFGGVQMYALNEDTQSASRYTIMKDLEDVLGQMRDAGIDVPTMTELREAGDIGMRNRVAETLMYGWYEDPETGEKTWALEDAEQQLLQILPKDVRDAMVQIGVLTEDEVEENRLGRPVPKGGRPEYEEGTPEWEAQNAHDFAEAMDAIETYLGRKLSKDEAWAMVSSFGAGGMGSTDQERAGLEPFRENRFLNPEKSEAEEQAEAERKHRIFVSRLEAVGMSWDEALERYPRIGALEGRISDAREAGWTEEEIREAIYYAKDEGGLGWTSREDRANINQFRTGDRLGGAVPLTTTRTPITSDEDLQKLQTKVWQAAEELRTIYAFEGWGTPSQEELFMYGVDALTSGEQRLLGIDPLKGAPNRDDTRSDAQKAQDAQSKLGAVERGLTEGQFRWNPAAPAVDIAPWEE